MTASVVIASVAKHRLFLCNNYKKKQRFARIQSSKALWAIVSEMAFHRAPKCLLARAKLPQKVRRYAATFRMIQVFARFVPPVCLSLDMVRLLKDSLTRQLVAHKLQQVCDAEFATIARHVPLGISIGANLAPTFQPVALCSMPCFFAQWIAASSGVLPHCGVGTESSLWIALAKICSAALGAPPPGHPCLWAHRHR